MANITARSPEWLAARGITPVVFPRVPDVAAGDKVKFTHDGAVGTLKEIKGGMQGVIAMADGTRRYAPLWALEKYA